jgi:prevent-host-death family protein
MVMKTISATKFKEQCLALIERVRPEGILITKRGKPVARLVPADVNCADLIGSMKGEFKVRGDILSTGIRWDAESGHAYPDLRARGKAHRKGRKKAD